MAEQNSFTINKDTTQDKPKIDLSSVEEVALPNGNRYVKYVDEKGIPTMLLINEDKKTHDIIESIQKNSNSFNSIDSMLNTNAILDYEKNYARHEIILVPIDKIEDYRYVFNSMTPEQKNIVSLYIKNKDAFNPKLRFINIDECIALDEQNRVITCVFNENTNRFDVNYADVVKYDVTKTEEQSQVEGSLDNIDFEAIFNTIETTNTPYEIDGYKIDLVTLEQYDKYPEIFEKKQMASRERTIWLKLLDIYRQRNKKRELSEDSPKVKIKTPPKNNLGFTSQVLTVSLATFAIGVIFGILIFVLKIFN